MNGYLERHQASGFQVGMWVRIMRAAENREDGWDANWNPMMDDLVGRTLRIVRDGEKKGFFVIFGDHTWAVPYFILQRADVGNNPREYAGRLYCSMKCLVQNNPSAESDTGRFTLDSFRGKACCVCGEPLT